MTEKHLNEVQELPDRVPELMDALKPSKIYPNYSRIIYGDYNVNLSKYRIVWISISGLALKTTANQIELCCCQELSTDLIDTDQDRNF